MEAESGEFAELGAKVLILPAEKCRNFLQANFCDNIAIGWTVQKTISFKAWRESCNWFHVIENENEYK